MLPFKSYYIITSSCVQTFCTAPHVWTDFEDFTEHTHINQSRLKALKSKSQWHSDTQHLQKTTLQMPIPVAQRNKTMISQNTAPAQQTNLTLQASIQSLLQKLPPTAGPYRSFRLLQSVANGCERLRPRKQRQRIMLYPRTPKVEREPFATHSAITKHIHPHAYTHTKIKIQKERWVRAPIRLCPFFLKQVCTVGRSKAGTDFGQRSIQVNVCVRRPRCGRTSRISTAGMPNRTRRRLCLC